MNSPNSEKLFLCTICILFNIFVPLNKENLQIMKKNWLSQSFHYSEVLLYVILRKLNISMTLCFQLLATDDSL